uniref:EF-hand and coiled-coil domain containing 1 n=1 Tax=Myripristis murdjan TaxID=586833 RepID=A0A667W8G8_9TELE
MERGAVAPSWPRAARKSEWLRGTLAHYHCPDPSVENEIVVLATGIDQYLQEVFHHLAYTNQDDTVSAEDFTALCSVLGLTGEEAGESRRRGGPGDGEEKENDEEFRDVCSGLPCELSFKDFHSRLCGYFRVRSARKATGESAWRLPVTEQTELVERQIRLRWPRVRRRKCEGHPIHGGHMISALRELVEDLRSALQGSDARCLALEVALQRERNRSPPVPSGLDTTVTPSSLMLGKLAATNRVKGQRTEEAREALRLGLQRVRLIQEQAQSVPELQTRITQLEAELHRYRYPNPGDICLYVCVCVTLYVCVCVCVCGLGCMMESA